MEATLRGAVTSLKGHSQPLATSKGNYILTFPSYTPAESLSDQTYWKPETRELDFACTKETSRAANRQQKRESGCGRPSRSYLAQAPLIIAHWTRELNLWIAVQIFSFLRYISFS